MSQIAELSPVAPLTTLQEEEQLFQASVRQFAAERLAPHVRGMDEEGKFRQDLLRELFEMGLMGINVKGAFLTTQAVLRARVSGVAFWHATSDR